MNKKKLREWMYIREPIEYDMLCDKCGGKNITWSEFEGMLWCFDCKIDTRGTEGIFDGPIPLKAAAFMGTRFDRYYFADKSIRKMKVRGDKLVWEKEE